MYIYNFNEFLFENSKDLNLYEKPDDKIGNVEKFKKELELELGRKLPLPEDKEGEIIKTIKDESVKEKGIKFKVDLGDGNTLIAYKLKFVNLGPKWEWYINNKKVDENNLSSELEDLLYKDKDYERWQYHWDSRDKSSEYSDDSNKTRAGREHMRHINALYNTLDATSKAKADEHMKK